MSRARDLANLGDGITTTDLPDITADKLDVGQIGGRRNLIINGAMQVAQRGTSFTSVTASAYHLDRFRTAIDTSPGTFTVSQSTDAPNGFGASYKVETTTANASNDTDDLLFIDTAFEGQNLQSLKKGSSGAESFTLSFWVKSSLTGTFTAEFRDYDNARHIAQTYTVDSANTWEYKTLTFTGDTTGSLDNDNAKSLSLQFWLHSGSRWNGGTLATSWGTYTDGNRCSSSNVNLGDTLNATFQITGVQLEVGSVATPFEHRSYGEELALCQRYYEVGTSSFSNPMWSGYCTSGSAFYANGVFKVTKRASPNVTLTSTFGSGFANTSGNPAGITPESFYEPRIATATQVGGFFSSTFVANAEL